ncbi:hypothetical protein B0T22DRAFT_504701 [Podospora appendiculata]|uniref:Monooxygenase n=1 Tax=Podospora appendiculata TaxID=314037 RepID=A0AAE0XGS6_9PEZI|nr:hypothetical protein B0T22DRAFT_504701 [Podospora appendiculata]
MDQREFKGIFDPRREPPPPLRRIHELMIKDSLKLRTLLSLGALIQLALLLLLPYRLAILPAVLLTLHAFASTLGHSFLGTALENPYIRHIVPGRTSAQIPSPFTGQHGPTPSASSVVVFHLGVAFNHPLGLACPGGREVTAHFFSMLDALAARGRDEYGLLGSSRWQGTARASHNTMLFVMYFKTLAGLHKFAHDVEHRQGWEFLERIRARGDRHITAFHETFEVPAGGWETIYLDAEPVLLGDTDVKVLGLDGKWIWVRSLVKAEGPSMKGLVERMRRVPGQLFAKAM